MPIAHAARSVRRCRSLTRSGRLVGFWRLPRPCSALHAGRLLEVEDNRVERDSGVDGQESELELAFLVTEVVDARDPFPRGSPGLERFVDLQPHAGPGTTRELKLRDPVPGERGPASNVAGMPAPDSSTSAAALSSSFATVRIRSGAKCLSSMGHPVGSTVKRYMRRERCERTKRVGGRCVVAKRVGAPSGPGEAAARKANGISTRHRHLLEGPQAY